ncbi:LacI family DNA-binding transcriptional regulator [Fodinicola feengrottensis]|uniref:LacI family DNA-binding transcriptional regulator n=1 Tax=Fodinicola feengrottensis TaxID=435914 RepID=A0ABP4T026_9ACTN|nr:LacI family DNA-binding transcriptional regulator [Fodinicola feengrottensis]
MGASLRDVALRAGVSVKTVSNVVNGYEHVTPTTRSKVEAALKELNYRPNLSARNLRRGKSGIIALALPELDSPYFAELARSVIRAAEERGYTVLIDQTDGRLERERHVLAGIRPQLVDGLIVSPLSVGREELAARTDNTPMVLLGETVFEGPADHVAIDNVAAAGIATEHLVALGRRRIAAIGVQPPDGQGTARLRLQGYLDALSTAGLPVDEDLIQQGATFHRADGIQAVKDLLSLPEPPDAVFCFNDLLALGAIRGAYEIGARVPDDIAIVGIDDIEDGRFSTPTLTTISPDKEQIARLSLEFLQSRIDGDRDAPPREVQADFRLMERESTGGRTAE